MYAIPVGLHQVVERGYLFFSNKIRYTTFYFDKFKLTLTIGNVKNIEKEFSLHLKFYSNKKYIKCMPLFLCNSAPFFPSVTFVSMKTVFIRPLFLPITVRTDDVNIIICVLLLVHDFSKNSNRNSEERKKCHIRP